MLLLPPLVMASAERADERVDSANAEEEDDNAESAAVASESGEKIVQVAETVS